MDSNRNYRDTCLTKLQFIKITPLETYIKNFLETYKEKESIPNLNTLYTQPCSFSHQGIAEYIAESSEGSMYWISKQIYENLDQSQLPNK